MWIRTAALLAICMFSAVACAGDMYRPADNSSASSTAELDATEISDKKNVCKEKWRKYRESQACFAQYRTAKGGVRPEAFKHCNQVVQPEFCE